MTSILTAILHAIYTLIGVSMAHDINLTLRGEPIPGALIVGKTEPGAQVELDGEAIATTSDGRFVFGLSRDATGSVTIAIRTESGTETVITLPITPREYDIDRIDVLPPKMVTQPPEWLERRKLERSRVSKGRAAFLDMEHWYGSFIKPSVGRYSGVYGSQRILNGKPRTPHYGVDIAAPEGTPIYAPAAGRVTLSDSDFLLEGGIIIIDHGYRVSSTLFHLKDVLVDEGEMVEQGDLIGHMGSTGRSTGSHVDWRINWGSVRLDPALVLPAKDRP